LPGTNLGDLIRTASSGPVSGIVDSYLGGLVGTNFGLIQDSTLILDRQRLRPAQHCGRTGRREFRVDRSIAVVDPSQSSGNVSSGPNSIVSRSSASTVRSSSPTERN
jgi:hypothetical protein